MPRISRYVATISYNTGTGRTLNSDSFQINSDGYLLSINIVSGVPATSIRKGQCWVNAGVNNANLGNLNDLARLASGYVTQYEGVTWTGRYPLKTNDYLFLNANSSAVVYLRGNFAIEEAN